MKEIKDKKTSMNLVEFVESKYLKVNELKDIKNEKIKVGDIIKVSYSIPEGNKERIQSYEGLIIAIKNRGLGKTFTLRRSIQGIGIEQIFLLNSPKITEITKKQSSKVRRSKLYFMRFLNGKSTRLKREF